VPSQVYMKYSRDGLDWGGPTERGTPIETQAGQYPVNCPVVSWFPLGGPNGVLIVSARGAAGGGDPGGRSLYWNTNNGVGPWWETPAPVQKRANSRAGWTQALMLKRDGSMLHITSSASADAPNNASRNEILFAAKKLDFNRHEAEDAGQKGDAPMRDRSMSNGCKVRLGAKDVGRLTFPCPRPERRSLYARRELRRHRFPGHSAFDREPRGRSWYGGGSSARRGDGGAAKS
jgi:hypothetical protein